MALLRGYVFSAKIDYLAPLREFRARFPRVSPGMVGPKDVGSLSPVNNVHVRRAEKLFRAKNERDGHVGNPKILFT